MNRIGENVKNQSLSALHSHPLRDAVLVVVVLASISYFGFFTLYEKTHSAFKAQLKNQLMRLAEGAASLVDGDLHESFVSLDQEKTPEYGKAVAPLCSLLKSIQGVKYIYTTRTVDDKVYFVLDSAPYGDADKDGVEDHSGIMQSYDDADTELVLSLNEGLVTASQEPYKDEWGTFISGYAPIFNSQGKQVGSLGVDMTVDHYEKTMKNMRLTVMSGLILPLLLSIFIGLAVYVARRRTYFFQKERIELQEQLNQSQKMDAIGKLAGGIAHDLNNLLTVINGYSSLILEPLPPKDPLRADLEEISKAGKRARDLTDQLLAFSRRQVVRPTSVDLNALLLNVGGMIKRLLGEGIEVVTIMSDSLKRVKVDSGQMEQVVMNLSVNARDAMSGKGKIVFETANVVLNSKEVENNPELKIGPYVRLSVTDTGLGMTDEVKRHLFEPFFTTKPKGKGTGLGLATCYGIVQQMGGHINVLSEVGKGTTMEVFLPVTEEEPSSGEKENEKEVLPKRSETILLVEDESMVRQFCAQVLSKQGYTLFVAQNGVEAVNLFKELMDKKTPIDLLLTDVIMPQMGGKETADKIKEIKPDLKVIFMSGYLGDTLDASNLLDSGNELIKKPFSPFSLLKTVDQVLGPA